MSIPNCPVIAIDGPTASGKGTVAALVAGRLGYHYLDSGAIYRVLAVAVERAALNPDLPVDLLRIIPMAANLPVQFRDDRILLGGVDVSESIRTEDAGVMASRLAVVPEVRAGLLQRQRDFRQAPGLVADGRDMGSVVFPDSFLKVFLTASAQVRAERRVRQIEGRGQKADFQAIYSDLMARDKRDSERAVAPLRPCEDALVLDCSNMPIDQVVSTILNWAQERI
ncbi:MAG: (d)CMP kinase [Limnobacter sp.]|jgi:CMP/dCMP kinase|uniref:Cytidylate kinase n=1 Tax=Limnobacter profundi TaxID=2732163 RepID=A0ABX6N8H8_9BURK|nr:MULTISPECIES: (d)CMP kinase [Burkholderiales]KJR43411.1 cytidylate kinase [Candidatus Magnetoovum chiemensis]MBT83116.1 cytidylate kinase [Sutterellaceae bacterium]PZO14415.1 MAG: (d)CMP kinase [Betaproteobacteria bacterium]MDZ4102535.1 (d)CMP kinase [Hydrogenophaga sp.]PZO23985.1 MAG: (d)CMP kinase [Betaproteobacteria bacterium]|tara:strand:+ start:1581 stop:2255 length:675 start_codon:yes stop_codon:yes gene_type:complete